MSILCLLDGSPQSRRCGSEAALFYFNCVEQKFWEAPNDNHRGTRSSWGGILKSLTFSPHRSSRGGRKEAPWLGFSGTDTRAKALEQPRWSEVPHPRVPLSESDP